MRAWLNDVRSARAIRIALAQPIGDIATAQVEDRVEDNRNAAAVCSASLAVPRAAKLDGRASQQKNAKSLRKALYGRDGRKRTLNNRIVIVDMLECWCDNIRMSNDRPIREWPVHFPDNNCPDDNAVPTDGPVFRLLCGDERDWKSATELGEWINHPECKRASLSCFLDASDAAELRSALPKFENHRIGRARLEPQHGKLKTGGSNGHASLWLRAQFLAIVQELSQVIE